MNVPLAIPYFLLVLCYGFCPLGNGDLNAADISYFVFFVVSFDICQFYFERVFLFMVFNVLIPLDMPIILYMKALLLHLWPG